MNLIYFKIKMAKVITNHISTDLLSRLLLRWAPIFKLREIQGWVQSYMKLKNFLPCNIQDQLVMTSLVTISKGQPCPMYLL